MSELSLKEILTFSAAMSGHWSRPHIIHAWPELESWRGRYRCFADACRKRQAELDSREAVDLCTILDGFGPTNTLILYSNYGAMAPVFQMLGGLRPLCLTIRAISDELRLASEQKGLRFLHIVDGSSLLNTLNKVRDVQQSGTYVACRIDAPWPHGRSSDFLGYRVSASPLASTLIKRFKLRPLYLTAKLAAENNLNIYRIFEQNNKQLGSWQAPLSYLEYDIQAEPWHYDWNASALLNTDIKARILALSYLNEAASHLGMTRFEFATSGETLSG